MLKKYVMNKTNLIIGEKEAEMMYNSIARIEIIIGRIHKHGTGFFMKIPFKKERLYFFVTNKHVIDEIIVNQDIKVIDLNMDKKLIVFFKDMDITLIQILRSDNILDEKFLIPDLSYKNGYDFYINKPCYLAGYPNINGI